MRVCKLLSASAACAAAWLLLTAPPARAVDGVTLLTQATAVSGLPGCGSAGFPIVICNPGSYRLAGNLNVPSGQDGIVINAAHVTLDLNGFTIAGAGNFDGGGRGITSTQSWITVQNGQVTGFLYGIYLPATVETVRQVTAAGNFGGITVLSGLVADSTADGNSSFGISNSLSTGDLEVVHCRIASNSYGIEIGGGEITESEFKNNQIAVDIYAGRVNIVNNAVVDSSEAGFKFESCCGGTAGYGGNSLLGNALDISGGGGFSMGNNICEGAKC